MADLIADLGADRNVLKVRVGGGESACLSRGLAERGMEPMGLGVHHIDQIRCISRAELLEAAVLDDLVDNRMLIP